MLLSRVKSTSGTKYLYNDALGSFEAMCGVHVRVQQVPNIFVREIAPLHRPLLTMHHYAPFLPNSFTFSLDCFFICKLDCGEISRDRSFRRVSSHSYLPSWSTFFVFDPPVDWTT